MVFFFLEKVEKALKMTLKGRRQTLSNFAPAITGLNLMMTSFKACFLVNQARLLVFKRIWHLIHSHLLLVLQRLFLVL